METGRDPSHAHAPSRSIALLSSGCPGLPRSVSPGRPAPIVASDIEHERGPVLVTIEYRIDPKDREPFLAALEKLARETPAYSCGVFEDAAEERADDGWMSQIPEPRRRDFKLPCGSPLRTTTNSVSLPVSPLNSSSETISEDRGDKIPAIRY